MHGSGYKGEPHSHPAPLPWLGSSGTGRTPQSLQRKTVNSVLIHNPVDSRLFLAPLTADYCVMSLTNPPQLGRYTKDEQLFLGPLGSTGDDTRCVVDDQISNFPQLLNCDKVANLKQKTWHFSQVRTQGKGQGQRSLIQLFPIAARAEHLSLFFFLISFFPSDADINE